MSDAKKGISASQLGCHISMTYKTAWYVAHRIREAMREAKDIQLGNPDTTVEIDETYIGGQLRHKGSKMAKASKTMVIGMAERNGRIHLESMSNRRFESIKPVLDAKLAENTKEVVTDGNPSYKGLIPREKHARGNHSKELREGVWTTTQTVENAFSLFKRAIVGNYHKLSPYSKRTGTLGRAGRGSAANLARPNSSPATMRLLRRRLAATGVLLSLLQRYQDSEDFRLLADSTRRSYVPLLTRIEKDLGDFPLAALSDRRTRGVFMAWRDKIAASSGRRQADYAWTVLARVLSWSSNRGLVGNNPCERGGRLYRGGRRREDLDRCR